MKILFLPHNTKLYGANKSMISLMKHLSVNNDILMFAPFKNHFKDILDENDIKFKKIPFYASLLYVRINNPKYLFYPLLVLLDIVIFPYLLYVTARFNPDIIYSNSSVENIGIIIAKILKKKHITHVREFGDLDFNFIFIFGKRNKQKYLNLSDGVIFNSNIIESTVLPKSMQKTKSCVIYNGIADLESHPHKPVLSVDKEIVFGVVGFIQMEKGQLEAISYLNKHLKEHDNIKLKIFGSGMYAYINKIKNYIANNNLANKVELVDFNKNVSEIYKSIHILLVFAKNEAFGRVTIEAMQYGLPVIAFNGGATKELIYNKVDGLLFSNEIEFDDCVNNLLSNDLLYNTISENAIKKVKKEFSEANYCTNIEDFINLIYRSN
jgi:glycosyltransferase involved in cell wall biosynthesis